MGPAPARDRTWLELTVSLLRFFASHAFAAGLGFVLLVALPMVLVVGLYFALLLVAFATGSGSGSPMFLLFATGLIAISGGVCLAFAASIGLIADLLRRALSLPILLGPPLGHLLTLAVALLAALLLGDSGPFFALLLAVLGSICVLCYSSLQCLAELGFEACERLVRFLARRLTSRRPSGAGTPR